MSGPPEFYVRLAAEYARRSPCEKSKRGAVIYDPNGDPDERGRLGLPLATGAGFNSRPHGYGCQGTVACRQDCGKICVHAESRAIRDALANLWRNRAQQCKLSGHVLVHVKVVNGEVVPGGPPSCWQCSREILDAAISVVWLFEARRQLGGQPGHWVSYSAVEFHDATLRHEKLHPYEATP